MALRLVVDNTDQPTGMDALVRLIDSYDAHQAMRGLSENTRRRRRWTLSRFAEHVLYRGHRFETADLADVEMFLAGRGKPASRKAMLGDLACFYRWATARGHLQCNPTVHVETIRVPRGAPRPLSAFDLELAIRAASPRLRARIMLGSHAGLRVSEIAALHERDVDHYRGVLVVRHGKGDKDRVVPLTPDLVEALRVLPRRRDGKIIGTTGAAVSSSIANHFAQLGIQHRPHDLRATYATEVARLSNGNMALVAKLLGHKSTQTTARYAAWTSIGEDVVQDLYRRAA